MEIAFTVYLAVGGVWAFIALVFNVLQLAMEGEFDPTVARFFFAAFVWPIVVVGAFLFVLIMGARAAWPEDWADAWRDYRAKRKVKARKETDY